MILHSSKVGEPARIFRQGKKVDVFYEKIGGRDVDVTITYLPSQTLRLLVFERER